MAGRVVVVGSYNHDLVWEVDALPAPGETRRGVSFRSGHGGKGMNQAVAAARQGAATTFIGAVGADAFADDLRGLATAEGIDARLETVAGAATGTAAILVDAQGRNSIVVALGANERLSVAHVEAQAAALRHAAVVLAPLESPPMAVARALALARASGARTILNPAPVHPELDEGLLALADLVTPNEMEFAQLMSRFGDRTIDPGPPGTMADDDLLALCRRLPCRAVVLTLGAAGVFAGPGGLAGGPVGGPARIHAPRVATVDTTGAGDAFNGALAAGWALAPEADPRAALARAVAVASLSTERHGAAQAVPFGADVDARFPA